MLQTMIYNPNISEEERMTEQDFIKMAKGNNDGEDFPKEYLHTLYESIKNEPLAKKENLNFSMKKDTNFLKRSKTGFSRDREDSIYNSASSIIRKLNLFLLNLMGDLILSYSSGLNDLPSHFLLLYLKFCKSYAVLAFANDFSKEKATSLSPLFALNYWASKR